MMNNKALMIQKMAEMGFSEWEVLATVKVSFNPKRPYYDAECAKAFEIGRATYEEQHQKNLKELLAMDTDNLLNIARTVKNNGSTPMNWDTELMPFTLSVEIADGIFSQDHFPERIKKAVEALTAEPFDENAVEIKTTGRKIQDFTLGADFLVVTVTGTAKAPAYVPA